MSKPIIEVENLSKCYQLGSIGAGTLRDEASAIWNRLRGRAAKPAENNFWAVRDVTFSVQPGEVVGVIGRNGAGKSTLLKLLSRITAPTSGRAVLRGRIASLLEVGTGFHPDLTGRENIFLNGAILGMTHAEIRRKFDEIVAFAEIEQFIDTPVKRYSSGMYVRLAFAVAAHLEPDILVVDEVLSVGDARFQKKCLGKIESVSHSEGRTILMVSHNMSAMKSLCNRGIYLERGRLLTTGSLDECIQHYLHAMNTPQNFNAAANRTGDGRLRFTEFHVESAEGRRIGTVASGEPCSLVFGYENHGCPPGRRVEVGFGLHNATGERLLLLYASHVGQEFDSVHAVGQFRCQLDGLPLASGRYYIFPRIEINGQEADFPRDGLGWIDVEELDFYGTGRSMSARVHDQTSYLIKGNWTERSIDNAPSP